MKKTKRGFEWSKEDVQFLINNYVNLSMDELCQYFGRSVSMIYQKASHLKLNRQNVLSHNQYCDYIQNNSDINVAEGLYTGMNSVLKFYCRKHDYLWQSTARSVYRTLRCPRCHINKKRNHDDFVKEISLINNNIVILSEFTGIIHNVKALCTKHNYQWDADPAKLLMGRGCPTCSESHGEKAISLFLMNKKCNFEPQKYFDNCRGTNRGVLKFDFCVYDAYGNIDCLIEFNGIQHYKIIDVFGGEDGYYFRQIHDAYKAYYCKKNNIRLIVIKYDEIDNVEAILHRELSL